ncbi:hypothetical protein G6Z34_13500 [Clostridium perfringens]|uniref:Uncharacterized protein n=1 Tax=Clostridium perfringens TaxID=1502 RepID=A0AAP7BWK9_CLOPF|nr:hypothetical protein [Clostridium perfringens]NGU31101.1 hypothetical protein [Clostridium perfringens]
MRVNVGYDCYIDSRWIPNNTLTGLYDINGVEIKTSNKIKLNGCTSTIAIIGKSEEGFMIYFGSKNGSVGWSLDNKTIMEHSIRVLE